MGSVFAAFDMTLRRDVAVKLLHPEALKSESQISRFSLEARAIAQLNHPHIAVLHDFHAAADPVPFLVMERIDGLSLRQLLHRESALALPRAVHIAKQVLSALGAAHRAGTVHRDVKPSNVMLVQTGAIADLTKLVDFGIARMAEGTTRQHHTQAGSVIGTLQYMPPEQARGLPVTFSADLYAVGVCLFEMIAGYNPFAVGESAAVLVAVRDLIPPDVRRARPETPPWLAAAIERALRKEPTERFASAEEFAAALGASQSHTQPPASSMQEQGATVHERTVHEQTASRFVSKGDAPHAPSALNVHAPARTGSAVLVLGIGLIVALVTVGALAAALVLRGEGEPTLVTASYEAGPPAAEIPSAREAAPSRAAAAAAPAEPAARARGRAEREKSEPPPAPASASTKPAPTKPAGVRCVCIPPSGDGRLCKPSGEKVPPCACRGSFTICSQPYTLVDQSLVCANGSDDFKRIAGVKPGAPCAGFRNVTDRETGTYKCELCATGNYEGNDGDSCQGIVMDTGVASKGFLRGCEVP